MSTSFIPLNGNKKVFARIKGTEKLTHKALRRGMFKSGRTLLAEANHEILKGNKTGRIYVRRIKGGRRRRHQASAPGETHANLTGTLRRSLSYQLRGTKEIVFGYGVSAGREAPDYARTIEFGSTKIKARPTLKNAINAKQGAMTQIFEKEIMDMLQ